MSCLSSCRHYCKKKKTNTRTYLFAGREEFDQLEYVHSRQVCVGTEDLVHTF